MLTNVWGLIPAEGCHTHMQLITSQSLRSILWKHLCLFHVSLSLYFANKSTFFMQTISRFPFFNARCTVEDMGNTKNISRWSFERHETKPAQRAPSSAFCLVFIILAGCHLQILHGSHATGTFAGVFPITQMRGTLFPPSLHWAISGSLSVFRLFRQRKVKLVLTFALTLSHFMLSEIIYSCPPLCSSPSAPLFHPLSLSIPAHQNKL